MDTHFLSIDGTTVAVHESAGDGPPTVLLHGNALSSRSFQRQLDGPLGARFRLLAMDFPGHGRSGRPSAPEDVYTIPGLARVVVRAAEQLGVSDATFVGWSLGGHVLLEANPDLPDAAGFCIYGAPPLHYPLDMTGAFHSHPVLADLWKGELTDAQITARVASMFEPNSPLPDTFLEDVRQSDPGFRTACVESLGSIGFTDEVEIVAALRKPLLVLHGALDEVVNLDYILGLSIPSLWCGKVHVVSHAAHAIQWDAPSTFDSLVGDFADAVARR